MSENNSIRDRPAQAMQTDGMEKLLNRIDWSQEAKSAQVRRFSTWTR
jgi:hypothetical protein